MVKKDLKKCRVVFVSGYGGVGVVARVYDEKDNDIARIDIDALEKNIARRIRGGLFEFINKGRKYQYIELK